MKMPNGGWSRWLGSVEFRELVPPDHSRSSESSLRLLMRNRKLKLVL